MSINKKPDFLNPEKLTDVLERNKFIHGEKITGIKYRKSETITSIIYNLKLKFDKDSDSVDGLKKMVLKVTKPDFELDGKKENDFYKKNLSSEKNVAVPICYEAKYDKKNKECYILMQDVTDTHHEISDYPLPPTFKYIEKAIDSLAGVHAFWWNNPDLGINIGRFVTEKEYFDFFHHFEEIMNESLDFLADRITPERRKLIKNIFSKFPELKWRRYESRENMTIIHGDAHLWNFFYPKDIKKGKALLIDWQSWELGRGAQDVAYMIAFHFYPEMRRELEKEFLKKYHEKMPDSIRKNYTFDEFEYDYKLSVISNFIYPIWQCKDKMSPDIWLHNLEIAFLNFMDLGCMQLLK